MGVLTVETLVVTENRGVPAAWLPFALLNLTWLVAWHRARRESRFRREFLIAGLAALFFSLDQIIVFQRVMDLSLIRGNVEKLMFPSMVALSMAVPSLRSRSNILLLSALLPLSLLLVTSSELVPRLVIPLQSLGIFYVMTGGVATTPERMPARGWVTE